MALMSSKSRPPVFHRDLELVVQKYGVVAGGRSFAIGDSFDKTTVNTRRLRQLYDQGYLVEASVALARGIVVKSQEEAPAPKSRTRRRLPTKV